MLTAPLRSFFKHPNFLESSNTYVDITLLELNFLGDLPCFDELYLVKVLTVSLIPGIEVLMSSNVFLQPLL